MADQDRLARMWKRRDVAGLCAGLAAATEDSSRAYAASLLGDLADPAAAEPLVAALGDPAAIVRVESAKALGRIPYEAARERLAILIAADPDPGVRWYAAWALATLHDVRAIPYVVSSFKAEYEDQHEDGVSVITSDDLARAAALRDCTSERQLTPPEFDMLPSLAPLLSHADPEVATDIFKLLVAHPHAGTVPSLVDQFVSGSDTVSGRAFEVLSALPSSAVADALAAVLDTLPAGRRAMALELLAVDGREGAVTALWELADSSDEKVAEEAVLALVRATNRPRAWDRVVSAYLDGKQWPNLALYVHPGIREVLNGHEIVNTNEGLRSTEFEVVDTKKSKAAIEKVLGSTTTASDVCLWYLAHKPDVTVSLAHCDVEVVEERIDFSYLRDPAKAELKRRGRSLDTPPDQWR